jgi:DNA modification methylase
VSTARFIVGDVLDGLASLPDESVDLILSSPPFLALRSYLPPDHPEKSKEIGSEPTPAGFLDDLLDVVEACDRVLAPHGSLVFELGDTYSGSGGAGGDYTDNGLRAAQPAFTGSAYARRVESTMERTGPGRMTKARLGWPLDKSLTGIPTLFAWSLAYGRNLLRPERTIDPWRIRNLVAWNRPNPPVGALGDKFRPATSYLTVACKSRTRYYDQDAVRTPHKFPDDNRHERKDVSLNDKGERFRNSPINEAGAPPLDWIEMDEDQEFPSYLVIPTSPYKGSHYATWPADLCVPFIKSMCPERVCRVCGEPSRRMVDVSYVRGSGGTTGQRRDLKEPDGRTNGTGAAGKPTMDRVATTLGWTACSHDDYRPGCVLDPFAGSGTTLMVATGHGRTAVGIDIDGRNADLARERVGMFLSVEDTTPASPAGRLLELGRGVEEETA